MGLIKYFLNTSAAMRTSDWREYKLLKDDIKVAEKNLIDKRHKITTPVTEKILDTGVADKEGCILSVYNYYDLCGVPRNLEVLCSHMSEDGDTVCYNKCPYAYFNAEFIRAYQYYQNLRQQKATFWSEKFANCQKVK